MAEQELNRKLAEFAGWHGFSQAGCGYPPNDISKQPRLYPIFTESLDACFKWLVPKLEDDNYLVSLAIRDGLCEAKVGHFTQTDYEYDAVTVSNSDKSALALCKAIEQLIDREIE